jgi:hypothetical protein
MNFDLKKCATKEGVRYVTRNGRQIAVETMPDPPALAARISKRAKKAEEAFVIIPLWWVRRASEDCGKYGPPNVQVCVELFYRGWVAKGKSFVMPKVGGVGKSVKIRSLRALEEAGLITVEWRPGRSPIITSTEPIW